jgi:cell division septal protein FtsQ
VGRLALVQPRSVRGGLAVPWRRAAAIAGASLATLCLLYLGARETPVFAVRTIDIQISADTPGVRRAIRQASDGVAGKSLVALDGAALVRKLETLPAVRSVTYDRAFPSTLRLFVQPEQPLAVVHLGTNRWVISARGRIIRNAPVGSAPGLAHFRLPPRAGMEPGAFLSDPRCAIVLDALALVPKDFPARVYVVQLEGGSLTFLLRASWGRPELRLGSPVDVAPKLAAAALVIRSLSREDRGSIGYVDASLPERVVVGRTLNSQVEG